MESLAERYRAYRVQLPRFGQQHLLAFWDELDQSQREQLLADLDQIDFARCAELIERLVRRRPELELPERLEPPTIYPPSPAPGQEELYRRACQRGVEAVRRGAVAAFTVAGGQGTRLGYDGPKGGFPISPLRSACLFELFAEYLHGVARRYGRRPRWYIMTSPTNHDATLEIFARNDHFGLPPREVCFFAQGQMPAFFPDGRMVLAEKHRVALAPDGHGGSLRALAESGALADMRSDGVEYISYFQVDNPLVKVVDPLFIGLHIETGSEMSSKAVRKADDLERVGNFCVADGRLTVIEYSDLPDELAHARDADGNRRFDAGSIAVHVLSRTFVERLTSPGTSQQLPWHRADKAVAAVDEAGHRRVPEGPNAVKLETFIFDAIPLAANPLVLYTPREEEFSPVKNATGTDSPATARRDLIRRAARWLEACGWRVPRAADGEPDALLEISPAFALDAEDLRQRGLPPRELEPGERLLLA